MLPQNQADATEPCFITDGPPSNDLPTAPYRTMSLQQILACLTDDELDRWPGSLANAELEKRHVTVDRTSSRG